MNSYGLISIEAQPSTWINNDKDIWRRNNHVRFMSRYIKKKLPCLIDAEQNFDNSNIS